MSETCDWEEACLVRIKHVCCWSADNEGWSSCMEGRMGWWGQWTNFIESQERPGNMGWFLSKNQYILKPTEGREAHPPPPHLTSQVWLILLVWLRETTRLACPEAKQGIIDYLCTSKYPQKLYLFLKYVLLLLGHPFKDSAQHEASLKMLVERNVFDCDNLFCGSRCFAFKFVKK